MQYVFTKTVNADTPGGKVRPFEAGEEIDQDDILAGCLESCLRVGSIKPIDRTQESDVANAESGDAPDQSKGEKSGSDTNKTTGGKKPGKKK